MMLELRWQPFKSTVDRGFVENLQRNYGRAPLVSTGMAAESRAAMKGIASRSGVAEPPVLVEILRNETR